MAACCARLRNEKDRSRLERNSCPAVILWSKVSGILFGDGDPLHTSIAPKNICRQNPENPPAGIVAKPSM